MDKLLLLDKEKYIFDKKKGIYSIYKKKWCECYEEEETGYLTVKLKCIDGKRRAFQYHRVMCFIFIPIPDELKDIPLEELQIDHIKPLSMGGSNTLDNFRWATCKMNNNNEMTKLKKSQSLKGRIITPESRKRMSESGKGKIITPEWRKKISESMKGENNHFYGKHHTAESKEKIRQSLLGTYNNGSSKQVFRYSLDDELIASYKSIAEACRILGIKAPCISACCNGKQKTYMGSKWSFEPHIN